MLHVVRGDMFAKPHQCITCPVNTVRTMGNGLAAYFAKRYPEIVPEYIRLLDTGELTTETPCLVKSRSNQDILLFATKQYWGNPSQPEWIASGLQHFVDESAFGKFHNINEIAFPALGCGKGGLDFESQVRPMMEYYLESWFGEAIAFDN